MHKNLSTSNKNNIKKQKENMEEYVYSLHRLTIYFCEAWVFACKAVSLHLKNISEVGSFSQIRMNIKRKKHLKPPASNVTILNTTNLMACDVVPLEQMPFCWIPVTRRSRARRVVVVDFASVFLAQPAGHRRSSQKRLARVVSSFPRWRLKKKRLPYHPSMAYVPTFGGFWW